MNLAYHGSTQCHLVELSSGRVVEWSSDGVMEWWSDGVVEWWSGGVGGTGIASVVEGCELEESNDVLSARSNEFGLPRVYPVPSSGVVE